MTDTGFFRGTSAEQDNRFSNKQNKLLKQLKFHEILEKKVDMRKVNLDIIKPWITKKITSLLGIEDDVIIDFIFNQLEGEKYPDAKTMQINLTGFLNGKNAREFMGELWSLLLSAEENIGGIPAQFIEQKKEEIKKRQEEQEQIQANIKKIDEKEKRKIASDVNGETKTETEKTSDRYSPRPPSKDKKSKFDKKHSSSTDSQDDKETKTKNISRDQSRSSSPQTKRQREGNYPRRQSKSPRHRSRSPRRRMSLRSQSPRKRSSLRRSPVRRRSPSQRSSPPPTRKKSFPARKKSMRTSSSSSTSSSSRSSSCSSDKADLKNKKSSSIEKDRNSKQKDKPRRRRRDHHLRLLIHSPILQILEEKGDLVPFQEEEEIHHHNVDVLPSELNNNFITEDNHQLLVDLVVNYHQKETDRIGLILALMIEDQYLLYTKTWSN
ncbi:serine/arginine repetitive matrix protein 1-like isoform X5 [Limulus polyphemus]|uniref:Serine/arginine repetitive matrix protein 1-like isoform X5 n=1 Tax=Limulus polyphemus TaxID=6850 RepID=A0ABM1BE56_LIMPO|nr:serine/arginine repetitive matrix protein 1-like isoform X5 [Limulus polyphemus]